MLRLPLGSSLRSTLAGAALALLLATPVLAGNPEFVAVLGKDAPKAADSKLVGRYEGAFIVGQTQKAFDELTLPSAAAEGEEYSDSKKFTATLTAQGKVTRTLYVAPEGRSSLEVFGNYVDDLKGKGFIPVFECAKESCGPSFKVLTYKWDNKQSHVISEGAEANRKMASEAMFDSVIDPRYALLKSGEAGNETYVAVFAAQNQGGTFGDMSEALQDRVGVLLQIVEPKAREQKIVTLTAGEIGSNLINDGKAIIYGIYFDFDKATIKPESQEQLDEIVSFLNDVDGNRFYIVGHTDNQGKLDYNIKLSQARAAAVVKALVASGIDAGKLSPKGVGPLAPAASNSEEEGRALNRRVEIVAQ